jgi:hypothetical protein
MTRRILTAVARTLRPAAVPDVHFHNDGSGHHPVPCFDGPHCGRPSLDLR